MPWTAPEPIPRIAEGGLPAVLSQTFRSLIHSRMVLGLKNYELSYPNTDIVLIEPNHRDPELYLANTFSYSQRRHLAEHAYQQTRQMLRSNQTNLTAKFGYHGITLNHRLLDDSHRHLCLPKHPPTRIGRALTKLHDLMNNLSQVVDHPRAESQTAW